MIGLLELQREEGPDILFLSETKLDRGELEKTRVRLNMKHMEVRDCEGRCGGLAIFWKEGVQLFVKPTMSRYHIDADVISEDGFKWRLTGLYGESKSGEKDKTWKLLRMLHGHSSLPWLCLGDFNEVLFPSEKQGGQAKSQACMEKFREALEFCGLDDLGYSGDPYTWRNNSLDASMYIRERLDRAVASMDWRLHFPGYKVINGDPRHSDHRPIIVLLEPEIQQRSYSVAEQPKFEARWLEEGDCEDVVKNAWSLAILSGDSMVAEAIRCVGRDLHYWSKEVLGDLKNRIKKTKKDLARCRKENICQAQVDKEHLLKYKLSKLQDQKNIYWKQGAHAHWLKDGDQNTSFFHACASERKRTNLIKRLKNDSGGVVEGEEELKSFIANYYQTLFVSSAGVGEDELLTSVPTLVTTEMQAHLSKEFCLDDINEALNSIGDLKAPGPDSMPAIFYKRF
jgi:exonuclease III